MVENTETFEFGIILEKIHEKKAQPVHSEKKKLLNFIRVLNTKSGVAALK